jgi:hypothetical protein
MLMETNEATWTSRILDSFVSSVLCGSTREETALWQQPTFGNTNRSIS